MSWLTSVPIVDENVMRSVIFKSLAVSMMLVMLLTSGIVLSSDPVSEKLRFFVEENINSYLAGVTSRGSTAELTLIDKFTLNISVSTGIAMSRLKYPEAAQILSHYVRGDGSDLELDSGYFRTSKYLNKVIAKLGVGDHGPLSLKQSEDWRMSLALNPYYLQISANKVRVFHPQIAFAPANGERVFTIVPIGKLRIKVFDNLVAALNPTPFLVFSEWETQ